MKVLKSYKATIILALVLTILSIISLFIGVLDINTSQLIKGNQEQWQIFIASRIPRLLAIIITGVGMSIAGLIMQQLTRNKFVSPTTGTTINAAQFGILLALIFMPKSTLVGRAALAFIFAIIGTWIYVAFIETIHFKNIIMVPLVGIMMGNIIAGITEYLAYKYNLSQALQTWSVGHFSLVIRGKYEITYIVVPLVILAFIFANYFNLVGMGKGLP